MMKLGKITTILSLAIFPAAVALSGQVPGEVFEMQPSAPDARTGVSPDEIIEIYGFIVGLQSGIRDFDLTADEFDLFLKGLNRAQAGEDVPRNIDRVMPQLQAYLGGRQADVAQRQGRVNREKAAAHFAELEERDEIEATEEGLFYEIIEPGTGERPDRDSMVRIHYEGRLLDGNVFDSSVARGEPAEFPLGGVIPGMAIGLTKIQEGGKIVLHIPADLAYGDQSQPTIPPGSALIFEVELIEVMEAPPQPEFPGFELPQ